MKLSWSHKLFFKINKQIGKRPWFDKLMVFCARWLVGIVLTIFVLWSAVFVDWVFMIINNVGIEQIFFLGAVAVLSLVTSYGIALLWKRPRPIKEFSETKVLISTVGTWKAFPSDHTLFATVLFISTLFLGAEIWTILFFGFATILIGSARVYVGVHYPRDIVGGFTIPVLWYIILIQIFI